MSIVDILRLSQLGNGGGIGEPTVLNGPLRHGLLLFGDNRHDYREVASVIRVFRR